MRDESLETKLTPAARRALEELVGEYRDQLLIGAEDSASRLGDLREISVHDIMAGVSRVQRRMAGPFPSSVERLLSVYVWAGIVLGLGGLFFFTVRGIVSGRPPEEHLPLLIALAGVTIAAMGYATLRARRSREVRSALFHRARPAGMPDYLLSYVSQWRDLELALRSLASSRLGESVAAAPLSVLLETLQKDGFLTPADGSRLRELLALRNAVMHGGGNVAPHEVESAARDSERLLKRLQPSS